MTSSLLQVVNMTLDEDCCLCSKAFRLAERGNDSEQTSPLLSSADCQHTQYGFGCAVQHRKPISHPQRSRRKCICGMHPKCHPRREPSLRKTYKTSGALLTKSTAGGRSPQDSHQQNRSKSSIKVRILQRFDPAAYGPVRYGH